MSLNMAGLELFCSDFRFRFTITVYNVAPLEMKAAKSNKEVNVPQKKTGEAHRVIS